VKIYTTSACAAPGGSATRAITVRTIGQATISGAASNTCPATTVELTASASGATSFTWYKNGTQVQTGTSSAYTVKSSGSYTVTGKDAYCSGNTSTSKVVTWNCCPECTCPGLTLVNPSVKFDGSGVDSKAHPACQELGGRVATVDEMKCLIQNCGTCQVNVGSYWTSTTSAGYICEIRWPAEADAVTYNCAYNDNRVRWYRCVK
jgi:hypothetical protein